MVDIKNKYNHNVILCGSSRGGGILRKYYKCHDSILFRIVSPLLSFAVLFNFYLFLSILQDDNVSLLAAGDGGHNSQNENDNNSATFWEWHRYSTHDNNNETIYTKNNNTTKRTRPNLLIAQYSSRTTRISTSTTSKSTSSAYNSILDATSSINRAYAKKYGYDYVILWGISYTFTSFWETWYPWCQPKPSRSTYNKIALLQYALANNQKYDYLLILDADAMLYDFSRNIVLNITHSHEDYFLTTHRVKSDDSTDTHNINVGVTLWNLHHPDASYIARQWDHAAKQRIFRNAWDNDQEALQNMLKSQSTQRTRRRWVYAIAGQFGGYERGRMVRHFKRPNRKTWTKVDSHERIQSIQASAQEVCRTYAPICDEIRIEEEEEEKEKKD